MLFVKRYQAALWMLLGPAGAMAMGLGDIHLNSALNAPLDAEIELVGASADEMNGLKATLASRDTFSHYGLDYPAFLGTVQFTPEHTSDGRSIIRIRSSDAVHEPFATLLVELNWPRGHLVREYTVLLDPPVFASDSGSAVAAPTVSSPAHSGAVQRTEPAPTEPANPSPASSAPPSGAGSTYTVHRGDTLSSIASRVYAGASHDARAKSLVGIYRANPNAFFGSMNDLRAGSVLRLPSEADIAAISPSSAASEVHQQVSAWSGSHPGGKLHLVAPGVPGAAGAHGGTETTVQALQRQVQDLQSQLNESQRLLKLKSDELAAMQAHGAKVVPAPSVPVATQPPAATKPPAAVPEPTAEPAKPPVAAVPPAPEPAPVHKPKAHHEAPKPAPSESIWDTLLGFWYVIPVLLAALLAFFGLRYFRNRSGGASEEEGSSPDQGFATTLGDMPRVGGRGAVARARDDQSYRVEESASGEPAAAPVKAERLVSAAPAAVAGDHVTTDVPVTLDQGDPLAEADFHMAYGLYDQAADLVKIALSREPQRRDLKLKLLEVYFVWGNKEQFLQTAHDIAGTRDQALPGEWEKVVIMGRQIAPDDALFSQTSALAGATSGGVDLNLEGGQNRVDFDLHGEPHVAPSSKTDLDLDLRAALEDSDPTGEALKVGDGIDFALGDAPSIDATGSTRELPAKAGATGTTATVRVASDLEADGDAPTVEQPKPALHATDNPTIRQKIDAAARAGLASPDQTAELAIDDLGLDLAGLAATGEVPEIGAENATLIARPDDTGQRPELVKPAPHADLHAEGLLGADDKTQLAPMRAGNGAVEVHLEDAHAADMKTSASGTWLFSDADLEDTSGSEPTQLATQILSRELPAPAPEHELAPVHDIHEHVADDHDTGSTSLIQAIDASKLDLDFGQLTEGGGGSAEHIAVAPSGGGAAKTVIAANGDQVLPDLEPATMSEVGTKLDLARAYIDMGDPEGARSILSEVMGEGSVSQKQEARRLLESLPGA